MSWFDIPDYSELVSMPAKLWLRARERASAEDCHVNDVIVEALGAWLRQPSRPKRESKASLMAELRERRRREQYGADFRERLCLQCGGEFPNWALANALYCSPRCRQRAYRERKASAS